MYFQLIRTICSFASESGLLNLRAVNHAFQREATRELRKGHKPVDLLQERDVAKFLDLMRSRLNPEDAHSFPFSAFKLDIRNSDQSFERFGTEAGQHTERLFFHPSYYSDHDHAGPERKVISLLCRTPNLSQVDLNTRFAIRLDKSDIVRFPHSFPRLSRIGVRHTYVFGSEARGLGLRPDSVTLVSLLINRAPLLKELGRVRLYGQTENQDDLETLRGILQHHAHRIPLIGYGDLFFKGQNPILQEMRNVPLRFKKLRTMLYKEDYSDLDGFQYFSRTVMEFLSTQSSCLQSLHLSVYMAVDQQPPSSFIYAIPPLAALQEFSFDYSPSPAPELDPALHNVAWLSIPLVTNQFPALRLFRLIDSDDDEDVTIVSLGTNPQASVQELQVHFSTSSLEHNSWPQIFPNLRTLVIHFGGWNEAIDRRNLSYVLTHFLAITSLELNFRSTLFPDFWDLLTGGSPRLFSTEICLHGALERPSTEPQDPVHGVYPTPSLGNLRGTCFVSVWP